MRIKGQGYLTKRLCRKLAAINRQKFSKTDINKYIPLESQILQSQDFDIVSVSGQKHFEEQVLSLLSFTYNVGYPRKWFIYSDGTYSNENKERLRELFPFVRIYEWNELPNRHPHYSEALLAYTKQYGIGKKTYTILNYHSGNPFLFVDSDIIFYPNFRNYIHLFKANSYNYFSTDNDWCCLDPAYMGNKKQDMYQLNSGLLFLQPGFNWLPSLEYLNQVTGTYQFYDQTAIHIAFFDKSNPHVLPFDPRMFKVEMRDHFTFKMAPGTRNLAVRHFVSTVRHKMWQNGWKWHLKKNKWLKY